jgi:hypothetical protein
MAIKVNRQQWTTMSVSMKESEVKAFEEWGSAMNFPSINQAIKTCIEYTMKQKKPEQQPNGEAA